MLILYNPPSSASRKPVLPMSLLALGAILEGKHDYAIVDGNLEPDPVSAITEIIRKSDVQVLAITVMPGPQLQNASSVCSEIKKRFPSLTIIWGGYFPTQHYDVCLKADYVDYVVRGHGELVLPSLVDALTHGGDPTHLQGLAYRDPITGIIIDNGNPPIPHPQDLPTFYPYHRVDVSRYIRATFLGERTFPHHSSYGCPFFCNFCAVVNMVNGRWMAQTAQQSADVVKYLVRTWDINAVEFYDNNFFTNEARISEFAQRIMGLNISWWGEARIDTLLKFKDRTWHLMSDSGLKMVFLGAESGSDETLERMNKGGKASIEMTLSIAAKMKEFGIVPEMSFVLGNPPNPAEDTRKTISFIRRIKDINPTTEIIMYMYTPVPLAGELYDQAKAEGFLFPESIEGWISPEWQEFSQRRSTNVPWLQDPVRRNIQDFQWVLNAYHPTTTDLSLGRFRKKLLQAFAAWRYHLKFYRFPLELRALNKLINYQRPEISGF